MAGSDRGSLEKDLIPRYLASDLPVPNQWSHQYDRSTLQSPILGPRENASGHSVRPGDVYVAVVRSKDGKTTAEFVWSGSRTPTALLVASRTVQWPSG